MAENAQSTTFTFSYIAGKILKIGLLLVVLYLISLRDYLLFHSLAEFIGAVLAAAIFLLAWNSRKFTDNGFYTFVGLMFLASGALTILHALAYRGMGVIPGTETNANLATQLWVANQYLLAAGFVAAPFFANKKPNLAVLLPVFSLYSVVALLSIFEWKNFPTAFSEVSGLTLFKDYSEYIVIILFLLSAYLFYRRKDQFDRRIVNLFYLALVLFAISSFSLTLYANVYGVPNLWGHLFRLAAMYPVYIGIVEFGLTKPYRFLFGNLREREKSLAKKQKLYRAVVEDQTEFICRFLPDGTLTFVNEAYCRYYGKSKDKLIGKRYFENVLEEVVEEDKQRLSRLTPDNPVLQVEHRAIDKSGHRRWQFWTTRALFDEHSKPIEFQSVGRDITRRKYMEEALRKSEETYRSLVDNSLVGIYRLDKDGNYAYVNEAMAKMFEFGSPEEMIRENVKNRYKNPHERESFLKLIREKGKLSNYEAVGKTKTGKTIVVLAAVALSGDDITGVVTDITERRKTEQALQVAKEEWEKTFDSVPDLIAVLDDKHKIVRINRAMAERLGADPKECIGLNCYRCVHGKNMPIAGCPHSMTLADGKEHMAEIEEKNLGGTFLVSTTPFFGKNGKLAGSVHVARDITERKKMEKAKDEFVSLASHQLRTPLSSIALSSELLLRGVAGKMEEPQKEYLDDIYKATKRMTLLVNNLLNVSRVEMGNFEVRPVPFDIAVAVASVVKEFSPLSSDKNLKVETNIEKGLPAVNLDEKSFGIIFENIFSNAIRYTPRSGSITVNLSKDQAGVLLAVSDSGCGIPAAEKKKIFSKSFRAENAREISSEGAGLGLYMARIAATRSGAKIWFESEEGKGTTFFVLFGK